MSRKANLDPIPATNCAADGCTRPRIAKGGRCLIHHREKRREQALVRRKHTTAEAKRRFLDRKNAARHAEKRDDPSVLFEIAAYKRKKRRESCLVQICTRAYLQAAKRDDAILTKSLREWLKANQKRKTREEKLADAREYAKQRYWQNPEAERTRLQAFKHSRPDYRIRWNLTRGEREAEASDGTITGEAVKKLFAASLACPYCGDPYTKSRRSLDHIVPLSKAEGRKLHSLKNVLVCCRSCNNKKHAKGLTQFLQEVKAAKRKGVEKSHPDTVPGLFECHSD